LIKSLVEMSRMKRQAGSRVSLSSRTTCFRVVLIAVLLMGISLIHYSTLADKIEQHAVHRLLYYFPLVLASFWFGLKGAAAVTVAAVALYLPFALQHWRGSFHDFDTFLEGGLFVSVALVLGFLAGKEQGAHAALVEAEQLAAVGRTVSEIAHDMKAPLMAIGGFASQLDRRMGREDPLSHQKLTVIVKETARLEAMLRDMLGFARPLDLRLAHTDLN